VVFWHYTVVAAVYCFSSLCSCFLLCTVIVHCKTFVTLLIEFLVYLSLLFVAVVFRLRARGGFFYTFCIVVTDAYYYCLCQFLPCWKGCGGPELGWVSVCHPVGRILVGAGWDGLLWLAGFY